MQKDHPIDRYEQLYEELRDQLEWLHQKNKRRVKVGTISMFAVTVALFIMRWMTDSDKVVFLLLWIACFVGFAAYLIGVEYLDDVMQRNFLKFSDSGEAYDSLVPPPEVLNTLEALPEKVAMRMAQIAEAREHAKEHEREAAREDGDEE